MAITEISFVSTLSPPLHSGQALASAPVPLDPGPASSE